MNLTRFRPFRAIVAGAALAVAAAGMAAPAIAATAAEPIVVAGYQIDPKPAEVNLTPGQIGYAHVVSPEFYIANSGALYYHTQNTTYASGGKEGFWAAVHQNNGGATSDGSKLRSIQWTFYRYGAWCGSLAGMGYADYKVVGADQFTGGLGCIPSEQMLVAAYGQSWYDTIYRPDSQSCATNYQSYATPRNYDDSSGGGLQCWNSSTIAVQAHGGTETRACAPWEDSSLRVTQAGGVPACMYTNYDWMPANVRAIEPPTTLTVSASATATKQATATRQATATDKVNRKQVKDTVRKNAHGKTFTGHGAAWVTTKGKGTASETRTATASVTRTANGTCTKPTHAEAHACALAAAQAAAQTAANTAVSNEASAQANAAALAAAQASAKAAATANANKAPIPEKKLTKAKNKAHAEALADVNRQIAQSRPPRNGKGQRR